jgi:hypothetical protein
MRGCGRNPIGMGKNPIPQGAVRAPVTVARQADMDDDKAFILAALRDAQEKMQRPFIGLARLGFPYHWNQNVR